MSQRFIFWLSMVIPGSGHMLLRRVRETLFGFSLLALEILVYFQFILPNFRLLAVEQANGKITIGLERFVDDSFLIMVGSTLGAIMLLVFVALHYGFARDAKDVKRQIDINGFAITFTEKVRGLSHEIVPNIITAPKFILLFAFSFLPAIVSIAVAFTNYKRPILPPAFLLEWKGFSNFERLFTNERLASGFWDTLTWTMTWTFCASVLTIVLGTVLAVVANNKNIRGKKFFRTVYILPWAVPAFLTILVFQLFFSKVGGMNTMVIPFFTGNEYDVSTAIGFFLNADYAKITIILIQAWLGFPYVFILVTGVLQTIPDDLYEASSIDGGNAWTNFFDITLPLILISVAPVFITQFTFNFNNVTIVYMLGEATVQTVGAVYKPLDTISSLGFRLMMDAKYNEAAVYTLIASTFVGAIVLYTWLKAGAFKNEEVM
ncbi:carbohydrate ABC transporter permease [Psychromonas sp. Urea-02u-13]|uniref:carbohydrate ABC transporter permease n=1 Tax=Psychromonas sp. Urea-02u-13 TaxID=2058326 RepID=UPI000C332476|nr:sugar ABC transporter permease [Psychromonas sp. Urea-02u-13]PKG40459.1 sugar ABC transporter permease [Psychromonas sp. Urea-02u-13]